MFSLCVCSVIGMVGRDHPLFLLKAAGGNEENVQIAVEHGGEPIQWPALCVTGGP